VPVNIAPLNMTKVAFGAQSLDEVIGWFAKDGRRGGEATTLMTTRYLPKRHAEMIGGSLYWILKHQLVARSEILGFEEAPPGGRAGIILSSQLVLVRPMPRRAHQGWRYLAPEDAPADLTAGEEDGDVLPGHIAHELAKLGLG